MVHHSSARSRGTKYLFLFFCFPVPGFFVCACASFLNERAYNQERSVNDGRKQEGRYQGFQCDNLILHLVHYEILKKTTLSIALLKQ